MVGGQGTILASVDAATWLPQSSGTELFITGVAAGAGTVVLAGDDGTILVPPAYLGSWQSVNDSATVKYDLYDITHGANGFVTVGQFGRVLISASGTHWIHVDEVVSTYLFGVTFAAGNYVAVGENGTIIRSGNGIDWAPMNSGTTEGLRAVAFGSDRFVASGANGTLLTSIDGSSWSPETSGVANTLYGVAYGNDRFVVVGSGGIILNGVLRLPTVLSAHFGRNPAELELSIASTPGETVSLEHATQLTNWSAVAVFTNPTGNLTTLRPWIAGMESEVFRAHTP